MSLTVFCSQPWEPLHYILFYTSPAPQQVINWLHRNLSSSCESKNNMSIAVRERSFCEMQSIFSTYLKFQRCFRKCPWVGTQGCFFKFRKLGCILGADLSPMHVWLRNSIVPHRVQDFPSVLVAETAGAADARGKLLPQTALIYCTLWALLTLDVGLCICSIQFSKIHFVLRRFLPASCYGLCGASLETGGEAFYTPCSPARGSLRASTSRSPRCISPSHSPLFCKGVHT